MTGCSLPQHLYERQELCNVRENTPGSPRDIVVKIQNKHVCARIHRCQALRNLPTFVAGFRALVRLLQKHSCIVLQPQAASARLHNTNESSQHIQVPLLNPLHHYQDNLLPLLYSTDQLSQLQPLLSLPPDPVLFMPHQGHSPLRTSALLNLRHSNLQVQVLPEPEMLALLLLHLTLMMIAPHQKMMQATILVTDLIPVPHLDHAEDLNLWRLLAPQL